MPWMSSCTKSRWRGCHPVQKIIESLSQGKSTVLTTEFSTDQGRYGEVGGLTKRYSIVVISDSRVFRLWSRAVLSKTSARRFKTIFEEMENAVVAYLLENLSAIC